MLPDISHFEFPSRNIAFLNEPFPRKSLTTWTLSIVEIFLLSKTRFCVRESLFARCDAFRVSLRVQTFQIWAFPQEELGLKESAIFVKKESNFSSIISRFLDHQGFLRLNFFLNECTNWRVPMCSHEFFLLWRDILEFLFCMNTSGSALVGHLISTLSF